MVLTLMNPVAVTLVISGVEIGPAPQVCSTEQTADEKHAALFTVKKSSKLKVLPKPLKTYE